MRAFIRLTCLLCVSQCLVACAPMLAVLGSGHTVVQVVAQAERIKLFGDGVSYVGSGKTITDHALSKLAGADCRILNVVSRDPVCAAGSVDAAADAKASLSLATEPHLQPAAQSTPDIDTAYAALPAEPSASGE